MRRQVIIDRETIEAAEQEAGRIGVSFSALVRFALRVYLRVIQSSEPAVKALLAEVLGRGDG